MLRRSLPSRPGFRPEKQTRSRRTVHFTKESHEDMEPRLNHLLAYLAEEFVEEYHEGRAHPRLVQKVPRVAKYFRIGLK